MRSLSKTKAKKPEDAKQIKAEEHANNIIEKESFNVAELDVLLAICEKLGVTKENPIIKLELAGHEFELNLELLNATGPNKLHSPQTDGIRIFNVESGKCANLRIRNFEAPNRFLDADLADRKYRVVFDERAKHVKQRREELVNEYLKNGKQQQE